MFWIAESGVPACGTRSKGDPCGTCILLHSFVVGQIKVFSVALYNIVAWAWLSAIGCGRMPRHKDHKASHTHTKALIEVKNMDEEGVEVFSL